MTIEALIRQTPALIALPRRPGVFLVGGTVRDLLLGKRLTDVDLAVLEAPEAYAAQLAARLGVRAIPIGRPGRRVWRVVAGATHYDVAGIPDGDLLHGVRFFGGGARTHSLVMGYQTKQVRFVDTVHMFDRDRPPAVRL